ncbi:MAG: hypothetical protein R6X33_03050 [Candidatus Brocadiia bacterium]
MNVVLAQLLQERGVVNAPESIMQSQEARARRIPDVLVRFRGLRVAIEGEVGDGAEAEIKAISSARQRLIDGIAHIGIAVVYPQELRSEDFPALKSQLAEATLRLTVITEAGDTGPREGNVDVLEQALRHAYENLLQEDAVSEAVALLGGAIDVFAAALQGKSGTRERLRRTLGVGEVDIDSVG